MARTKGSMRSSSGSGGQGWKWSLEVARRRGGGGGRLGNSGRWLWIRGQICWWLVAEGTMAEKEQWHKRGLMPMVANKSSPLLWVIMEKSSSLLLLVS